MVDDITLISIDGIPGSGKSTTALWLAEMLQKKGGNVLCVPENENPHPTRYLTQLRQPLEPWSEISPEDFSKACLHQLTMFLDTVRLEKFKGTVVLDGLFFHTDVTTLFLMNWGEDLFKNHLEKMYDICSTVKLFSICFWHTSPASSLQKTLQQRPKEWGDVQILWKTSSPFCVENKLVGEDGYLSFYEEYERVVKKIITSTFPPSAHLLEVNDPQSNWLETRKKIWATSWQRLSPSEFLFE